MDTTTSYASIDISTAGAAVWWRLSGGLRLGELTQAWEDLGLDEGMLPKAPSAHTALARAAKELAGPRTLIRCLQRGGWAVVHERPQQDGLDYNVSAQVHLRDGACLVTPEDFDLADTVKAAFARHQQEVTQTDVSSWLAGLMKACKAVSLRDTGGIYFVPRQSLGDWHWMVQAIRAASNHVIFEMPCMRTDDAVRAIVDALTQEAEAEVAALSEELDKTIEGETKLGGRALDSRLAKADRVKEKVASYETLLGTGLATLHSKLDAVRAQLARARLATSTDSLGLGRLEDLG